MPVWVVMIVMYSCWQLVKRHLYKELFLLLVRGADQQFLVYLLGL